MPKIVDKEAKRAEIVEAATKIFARDGLAATKMAHIADEAGVGKGTIYEYFDGKMGLFWAVCENLVSWPDDVEIFKSNPSQGIRDLIKSIVDSYESSNNFFIVLLDFWGELLRNNRQDEKFIHEQAERHYAYPRRLLISVIEEGKAKGIFRADIDSGVSATIVLAAIEGLRSQKVQDPEHIDFEASVDALTEMILNHLKFDQSALEKLILNAG